MSKTNNSNKTIWSGAIFCIGCGTPLDYNVPIEDLQECGIFDIAMCLSCNDTLKELNKQRTADEVIKSIDELIKSIANWD